MPPQDAIVRVLSILFVFFLIVAIADGPAMLQVCPADSHPHDNRSTEFPLLVHLHTLPSIPLVASRVLEIVRQGTDHNQLHLSVA